MDCRFARRRGFRLAAAAWLGVCAPLAVCAGEQNASPPTTDGRTAVVESFRHDAALADVCFLDRVLGWAVGDRGVIWHTDDGGATWQQQSSGVTCRLNSVFFIDARRGWAIGGESRPYTGATRGVVLRTDDGGQTWSPVPRLILPLLTRVKFFDADCGVALGDASSFHPSGVFITHDGGDTWQPLPADRAGGWLTGDFLDPDNGAVAGPAGRFATLARRQIVHSPLAAPALHSFHAMRLVAPTGGWLVGDGGLVMTTRDLGHSWQTPPTDLPNVATNHFDFHAVAVHGPHVWVAGSPGTRVFHSPDSGHTWQAFATGQSAPIRALTFIDAEHGWAVGELGNVLATHDGGQTWQSQRAGGQRAALLGIFADAADVPLELFAEAGAAEGYIAAIEILHTMVADLGTGPGTIGLAADKRTRQAMRLAGAAAADTAWRFPLPPANLALDAADLLDALNAAHDGRAIELLERHLVRTLRTWRPQVVVTHHAATEKSQPRASLVAALIMRAVEAAADPTRHVELANEAGLPPWQVKKVYGLLPRESHGAESVTTGRFSPWLGATLADFVSPARQLLHATHAAPPGTYELELLMSQSADGARQRGLFSGIAPGPEARRPQPELPVNDLDDLRRMATRRRHLEELLQRSEGDVAWSAQVARLTDDLHADAGASLLMQLADGYRAAGRLDLAADTYYLAARRWPDHPLVDRALVWLVQFYASSETTTSDTRHPTPDTKPDARLTNVRQTAFNEPDAPAVGLSRDDRLRRAVQLAEYLKDARPAIYAEPAVRFAEVVAHRQLGFTNPATRYFLTLRGLPETDPWRQCADTEEWLSAPADLPPPKPIATCRRAHQRPHLDGHLDEPFWDTADRLRLRNNTDRSRLSVAAELRLAYDDEFLYIAIRCPKVAGAEYEPDDRPRPRDADLTEHDRVTLRLDVDRDYATAFEFTVDHRGWTHDACWGDAHWDPSWYVAAAGDDDFWTVEAAVPLAELVAEPPAARHVWAVAARRTIPRVGYQSWTNHAAKDSPAHFGLLIFE